MKQLNEHHTFTGMQQDLDISKHPAQFLYHARNVRLTPRNGDTLFAVCNEKGTSDTRLTLIGEYLGHCQLNQYLVVFTHNEGDAKPDYIYRIDMSTDMYDIFILYNGDLGFSTDCPIEAIASYENTQIQKVYWTDGYNQPRVINIVGDNSKYTDTSFDFVRELKLNEDIVVEKLLGSSGSFAPGVIQYAFTYYTKYGQESNIFYTTPLMYISHKDRGASPEDRVENSFKIQILNPDQNFDCLRIYSIQRTSVDGVPIVKRLADLPIKSYKLVTNTQSIPYSYEQSNVFLVRKKLDDNFISANRADAWDGAEWILNTTLTDGTNSYTGDWVRFNRSKFSALELKTNGGYITWLPLDQGAASMANELWVSMARINGSYVAMYTSSASSTTAMKAVYYEEEEDTTITYIDNGTQGDSIDPTELLYKGGESITAKTIEQKDNTLFLGNIGIARPQIAATLQKSIQQGVQIIGNTRTFTVSNTASGSKYKYANQLSSYKNVIYNNTTLKASVPCGGFKTGDYYRLGVQFQHKTGKWSDPVFIEDYRISTRPGCTDSTVTVPTIQGVLDNDIASQLIEQDYKKVRPVVVFPDMQDRVVLCQGVVCKTVRRGADESGDTDNVAPIQSSWFWRPAKPDDVVSHILDRGTVTPDDENIYYMFNGSGTYPTNLRATEIQGNYDPTSQMVLYSNMFTFHSPDVEFDERLALLDFTNTSYLEVGLARYVNTLSDISIQLETPPISSSASGFIHKTFTDNKSYGIISGLFYEDYIVNDSTGTVGVFDKETSSVKWMVYPWQRSGSLNNDYNRPANQGVRSAMLKKKVISNLRYAETSYDLNITGYTPASGNFGSNVPQIFNQDYVDILKFGNRVYFGNVDTVLSPDEEDGLYYAFDGTSVTHKTTFNVPTSFSSTNWYKTTKAQYNAGSEGSQDEVIGEILKWVNPNWRYSPGEGQTPYVELDNKDANLMSSKESVRMKYKSTQHLVLPVTIPVSSYSAISGYSCQQIIEILKNGDVNTGIQAYWRTTMFGGNASYGNPIPSALRSNVWVPCGEPVRLGDGTENVGFEYSYGDTYFQRWDCLKTYPFTKEDINQIVEIGSFMLETRVNIDGRYDRNRGQLDNTNMSPENFNLLNPVYSQIDNFFSYKILDEQYYSINRFPNEVTWTKEKAAGADTDAWTNITLGSTYDMDGSKGEIISLNVWKDNLYCFQNKGVSTLLFNSRVQIPASDGVPIEISNSYKMDGYRYLSDGVGCKDSRLIKETPAGIYFMDSISIHLYYIGEGIQDVSATHNMSSWFNQYGDLVKKVLYDDVYKDIYLVKDDESMCYSELLGQFTGFYDYDNIKLIESWNKRLVTLKDSHLFEMFAGEYNDFFGYYSIRPPHPETYTFNYKPWYFTFVSNGAGQSTQDFDKIFTNIDYRMDIKNGNDYSHDATLNFVRAQNEYQDTRNVSLGNKNGHVRYAVVPATQTTPKIPRNYIGSNVQKKFRIWRIQIPRSKKQTPGSVEWVNTNDRIRNTWCKITLGFDNIDDTLFRDGDIPNGEAILHDLNVQYYV